MTLEQFLLNLFFAALSAFLGIVIGVLWAQRQQDQRRRRQLQVLRANVTKAFRSNLDRIEQCLDYLQRSPVVIPNFRLDTSTVVHILFSGRDLFDNEALFDRFSWQRYQLEHINAKLDYIHTYLGNATLSKSALNSLVNHLNVTQSDISQLLEDYESQFSPPAAVGQSS